MKLEWTRGDSATLHPRVQSFILSEFYTTFKIILSSGAVEVLFNSTEPEKHSISYSPWTRSAPGGSCPVWSKDTVRTGLSVLHTLHPSWGMCWLMPGAQGHCQMNEWNPFHIPFVKLSSLFHWLLVFHVTLSAPSQCCVCGAYTH